MTGYFGSAAGRALVLAGGVFLTGLGLASLLASSGAGLVVSLLAPAAAVGAALASVALGIERYPLQSLLVTTLGPLVLLPSFVAAGALRVLPPAAGHVLLAAGIVVLAGFVLLLLDSPALARLMRHR